MRLKSLIGGLCLSLALCSHLWGLIPAVGGLTNESGFEWQEGRYVFVKTKPERAEALGASWQAEIDAGQLAYSMGFAPEILHIDPVERRLVFEVIENSLPFQWSGLLLEQLAGKLKRLHEASLDLPSFTPSVLMKQQLEAIIHPPEEWFNQAMLALDLAVEMERSYGYECKALCHLDLWTPNILLTQSELEDGADSKLWVIDWEYAALADPAYDLANFCAIDRLNEESQREFLGAYYGSITPEIWQRHLAYQSISCLRWSIWFGLRAELYNLPNSWDEAKAAMDRSLSLARQFEESRRLHPK